MNKDGWGLTTEQAQAISNIIAGYSDLEISCQGLKEAAMMFRGAAEVCELAATLHEKEGREVLLKTACQRLYLPTEKQDAIGAGGSQELAAKMFGSVNVRLIDQIANRRDAWEPKLVAVKGESNEQECCNGCINSHATCVHSPEDNGECVGRETEQEWHGVREDLTALGEEPKGDEQQEICSECGRRYSICGYHPWYQDCEWFER